MATLLSQNNEVVILDSIYDVKEESKKIYGVCEEIMKKLFTIIIVMYPILNMYATPIASVSVSDLLLLFWVGLSLIISIKRKMYNIKSTVVPFFILLIYMIIQLLILIMIKDNEYSHEIFLPTIRLLFYFFVIAFYTKENFIPELGLKIFKYAALFASFFIIGQKILLDVFKIYIPGTLKFLPLMNDSIYDYNAGMYDGKNYRLRSVFKEPSYFAIYVGLYFAISVINMKNSWIKVNIPLLVGLLISASTTAIAIIALTIILFFMKILNKLNNKNTLYIIIFIIFLIIGICMYIKTKSFNTFYERTFVNKNAVDGRFGNYKEIFTNKDSILEIVFGNGIHKVDYYIPTIPRIFYYFGITGMIYFICIAGLGLIKLKNESRTTLIVLIALSFASELLFGQFILLYMAFIAMNRKEKEYEMNEFKYSLLE